MEEAIISMAGYFPFFVQMACSVFFEYAFDYPVSPAEVSLPEIRERFLTEAGGHFEYIWDHCQEDQQEVLLHLAEGNSPPKSEVYLLRQLQKQGYVIEEDGQMRLFSDVFAEYILERPSVETLHGIYADSQRIHRIEQELLDAQVMQRAILPSEDPVFAGLDISSYFRPATEIGGDYYDYIPLSETELGLAIGDVKGHGMPAGLMVSTASGCLHTTLETTQSVADVMRVMNRRVKK